MVSRFPFAKILIIFYRPHTLQGPYNHFENSPVYIHAKIMIILSHQLLFDLSLYIKDSASKYTPDFQSWP